MWFRRFRQYDLDAWPRNPNNIFKLKNLLFGATHIVKNSIKEKYVYRGYRITFDRAGSWSFDNDSVRNFIVFGVDNSISSHADNRKNKGKGPKFGINGSFISLKKNLSINFSKANTEHCLSLHYNADNSYFLVKGKEILKFKANDNIANSLTHFYFETMSNGLSAT